MGQLVVTGAQLTCSFGGGPATFAATGVQVSSTAPAGVITDITPANVSGFIMCLSPSNPQVIAATSAALGVFTPQPCIPVLTGPWAPGSLKVKVGGVPALDNASTCNCAWAGVVTVASPGQVKVTV
ncbi:MAG TPA: DUF4280 domain-containing protein [Gaiellaceae bacterium]